MDNHIKLLHLRPHHVDRGVTLTLLVGDSHLGSVRRSKVEKAMGKGARLVTPGATRPGEDRAYCSSSDWPEAKFPQNTLVQMVPELLGERRYENLILMAPTNDISNLKTIKSQEEREHLARLSAMNTVYVAEQAMEKFPSLKEVLIMEHPVRVDNLAELSNLSNRKLRECARTSPLAGRMRIGSNQAESCNTEEQRKAVFGPAASSKSDGIHMRGEDGKKFMTNTFVLAVKHAGLADRDNRLGGGGQISRGLEGQEQEPTWAQVVRRPQSAAEVDGQQLQSLGDVRNNQFYTLGN